MAATLSSPAHSLPMLLLQQARRIGPLGAIILLHVGFFYALQSGLLKQAAQTVAPREVIATFVTPNPAPEPPKPQPAAPKPAAPKTVPVVKKAVTPQPKTPVVNPTPAPQAITAPPAESTPEPAAPAPSAAPSPPAPASTAPAQPRTISTGIEYVQPPQPKYPPLSSRMGEEGKVLLRVLVNEKGRPERVEIEKSSGFARLDEAARQAAMRAVFKPFTEGGRAVPAYALTPINFQLDK